MIPVLGISDKEPPTITIIGNKSKSITLYLILILQYLINCTLRRALPQFGYLLQCLYI